MREPQIHSHITDALPDDHLWVGVAIACDHCGSPVQSRENRCLQTWVETGRGAFCFVCFGARANGGQVLEDGWALPDLPRSEAASEAPNVAVKPPARKKAKRRK